jgi:DNA-binding beta-propeller fold protein YncE
MEPTRAEWCSRSVGKEEKMKRALVPALLVAGLVVLVGSALGAGPSPGVTFGSHGVVSHDGKTRYLAMRAGRGTLVQAVTTRGGVVLHSRFLRGPFGIPLVAYDGSAGGLARNGRRLVVYAPSNGQSKTRFVVLDPRTLKVRSRFALAGNFGFDALSPDGSTLYLIQLKANGTGLDYDVRALNVSSGRLYPGSIVDRREPGEKMTGIPLTRVGSDDARWAYTLYSKSSGGAFVHALHTTAREAFCIDIPHVVPDDQLGGVRMRLTKDALLLRLRGKTVATIDTRTFEVKR